MEVQGDLYWSEAAVTQTESELDDGDLSQAPVSDRERWGQFESIGLAVLIALTARVALAVFSGIAWASYDYPIGEASRFTLGTTIQYASGFGDVQGMLYLMVLTGFLWWAFHRQSEEYQEAFEHNDWSDRADVAVANVSRLAWMTDWLKALYVIYIIGSVALAISYALQIPIGQWAERTGSVGFVLTYSVIGVCGMLVAFQLGRQVQEFFVSDVVDEGGAEVVDDRSH